MGKQPDLDLSRLLALPQVGDRACSKTAGEQTATSPDTRRICSVRVGIAASGIVAAARSINKNGSLHRTTGQDVECALLCQRCQVGLEVRLSSDMANSLLLPGTSCPALRQTAYPMAEK